MWLLVYTDHLRTHIVGENAIHMPFSWINYITQKVWHVEMHKNIPFHIIIIIIGITKTQGFLTPSKSTAFRESTTEPGAWLSGMVALNGGLMVGPLALRVTVTVRVFVAVLVGQHVSYTLMGTWYSVAAVCRTEFRRVTRQVLGLAISKK